METTKKRISKGRAWLFVNRVAQAYIDKVGQNIRAEFYNDIQTDGIAAAWARVRPLIANTFKCSEVYLQRAVAIRPRKASPNQNLTASKLKDGALVGV